MSWWNRAATCNRLRLACCQAEDITGADHRVGFGYVYIVREAHLVFKRVRGTVPLIAYAHQAANRTWGRRTVYRGYYQIGRALLDKDRVITCIATLVGLRHCVFAIGH